MEDNIDESIEAFEILLQQGKIRYYGLSSIRPNIIREHIKHGKLVSVMTQYSLLDRRPEEATLDLLKENNIGIVTRGTVASGLLVDKPAKAYLNWSKEEVSHAAEIVKSLSTTKRSSAQIAIQYVLQHPGVTSAIIGMRTLEQLEDAIRAIELPKLSEDEMSFLTKNIPQNFYKEHR